MVSVTLWCSPGDGQDGGSQRALVYLARSCNVDRTLYGRYAGTAWLCLSSPIQRRCHHVEHVWPPKAATVPTYLTTLPYLLPPPSSLLPPPSLPDPECHVEQQSAYITSCWPCDDAGREEEDRCGGPTRTCHRHGAHPGPRSRCFRLFASLPLRLFASSPSIAPNCRLVRRFVVKLNVLLCDGRPHSGREQRRDLNMAVSNQ